MRDPWLNIGYEDDPLRPHEEPVTILDERRISESLSLDMFFVLFYLHD